METYHGIVRTPADAIKLFEACRLGLLPRVQRRLSEKERQSIRSGSVFVWDEREAGMRRWTDGKSWSASRVAGSFLTYREMEGKRGGGFGGGRRIGRKSPDSGPCSDEDRDDGEPEGYRYKADGLLKQSFSITTSTGQHLHLISYYARTLPGQSDPPQPTADPALRGIVPVKGMYPESSMGEANQTPALTRVPMQPQQPYLIASHHHHPYHVQPHHQPPYGPHYTQTSYMWPPSPMATPPTGHFAVASYPPAAHSLPPPYPSQPPPPSHHSEAHAHPHYAHTLPPPERTIHQQPYRAPETSSPAQPPHQTQTYSEGPTPPLLNDSPRQHTLQAAAQAAMVDTRIATAKARTQGLPALNSVALVPHTGLNTPPTRALSVTSSQSSQPDTFGANGKRTSLSALLHPTPLNGESVSGKAKASSPGGSPKPAGMSPPENGGNSEDVRALRALDRKFCI